MRKLNKAIMCLRAFRSVGIIGTLILKTVKPIDASTELRGNGFVPISCLTAEFSVDNAAVFAALGKTSNWTLAYWYE